MVLCGHLYFPKMVTLIHMSYPMLFLKYDADHLLSRCRSYVISLRAEICSYTNRLENDGLAGLRFPRHRKHLVSGTDGLGEARYQKKGTIKETRVCEETRVERNWGPSSASVTWPARLVSLLRGGSPCPNPAFSQHAGVPATELRWRRSTEDLAKFLTNRSLKKNKWLLL